MNAIDQLQFCLDLFEIMLIELQYGRSELAISYFCSIVTNVMKCFRNLADGCVSLELKCQYQA